MVKGKKIKKVVSTPETVKPKPLPVETPKPEPPKQKVKVNKYNTLIGSISEEEYVKRAAYCIKQLRKSNLLAKNRLKYEHQLNKLKKRRRTI